MKLLKLTFLFLTLTCAAVAEQKFIYFTARVIDFDKINESQEVNNLLKKGWKIKNITAAGVSDARFSNVFILLERNEPTLEKTN